jgi:hypothetical protein
MGMTIAVQGEMRSQLDATHQEFSIAARLRLLPLH